MSLNVSGKLGEAHKACFDHKLGPHHPERLEAVLQALKTPEFVGVLSSQR